jgi:subtilase family serine protease
LRGIRLAVGLNTPSGTYWMIVCIDATNRVRESNERNNCMTTAFPVDLLTRAS